MTSGTARAWSLTRSRGSLTSYSVQSAQCHMQSICVSAVLLNLSVVLWFFTNAFAKMSAERLAKIPEVDLDPDGVFKYVLIRVHSKTDESYVDIVRGYAWAEYHADIYDRVSGELEKAGGVDCECLGGGRIKHNSAEKKIHVYGYSMGFGRARHSVSTEKIKSCYPDYEVTWADEGY